MNKQPSPLRQFIPEKGMGIGSLHLAVDVGYFVMWYGACEGVITHILANVLGFSDHAQRLEFITRGLDAKAKCERLRQAAKLLKPIGKNLDERLVHFQTKVVPLRNRLVHNWLVLEEPYSLHFTSLGKIHGDAFRNDPGLPSEPVRMSLDDLHAHYLWLYHFSNDLLSALESATGGGPLEVADPQSDLPKGQSPNPPPKGAPAKAGTRARTRKRTRRSK